METNLTFKELSDYLLSNNMQIALYVELKEEPDFSFMFLILFIVAILVGFFYIKYLIKDLSK